MERRCFLLHLKKEKVDEYRASHDVWPEMREVLKNAGIQNYSLFLRPDGLVVGYLESENIDMSLEKVGNTEVNTRWQNHMAEFFEGGSGDIKEGGPEWLEQYFYLA